MRALVVALLLGPLAGCGLDFGEKPAPAAGPDDVTRAATLALAIKADPDNAADVLAAAGMTEDELDALLFDIAEDPTKSEAYAQALGVADGNATAEGEATDAATAQNE